MKVRDRINEYTQDPLIGRMWHAIRSAGPMRSISVDITHRCNLRCKGCYFFAEEMDQETEADRETLDRFIEEQVRRGITFATVIGGEPSLVPDRLRALAEKFRLMIVTNGLKKVPREGLEDVALAVSVWGDAENDRGMRGYGRIDVFQRALSNFRNDDRVIWYVTLPSDPLPQTAEVVDACIDNGNMVSFNYYGDVSTLGGKHDHRNGFAGARRFVAEMIDRHPNGIAFNSYLNEVISGGVMKGQRWGYDVCGSVSVDHPGNRARISSGQSYNPHFNAYGPGLTSTRRCCVGDERDCATCFDVWAHVSWIALGLERHLDSREDFFEWLSTMYIFYGACRMVDRVQLRESLPLIHQRSSILAGEAALFRH
ncbi:radical SAM protein [Sphingomonas molluscorum]|uniref:radical SAM protein n=1 Tax=Sphingomonas molluscorum TaxID=418184 RepID=UPI0031DF0C03